METAVYHGAVRVDGGGCGATSAGEESGRPAEPPVTCTDWRAAGDDVAVREGDDGCDTTTARGVEGEADSCAKSTEPHPVTSLETTLGNTRC